MSKKITKDDVVSLAKLAQLKLTEEEVGIYQKELSAILSYIDKLSEADTSGLKPTYQVSGLQNVTRKDEIGSQLATSEELLSLAPDRENDYIKVRRMI